MHDQRQASKLAKEAFDLWIAGYAEDSIPIYRRALELADPSHYGLADYHGEFAGALWASGRHDQAVQQFEIALDVEKRNQKGDLDISVVLARYFLADCLLKLQKPDEALTAIEPSLKEGVPKEWLLRYIKALALHATGQISEARQEADLVLQISPNPAKRDEFLQLFNQLFNSNEKDG